jgi:hypothetical protein
MVMVVAMAWPAEAAKPIIVGNGTPASCTETTVRDALLVAEAKGGATVRFNCGPTPVTIAFTHATDIPEFFGLRVFIVLPNDTTMDGDGLITLDGSGIATLVLVAPGTTGRLNGITLTNGVGADMFGGPSGGIANSGTLTLRKSTVTGNYSIYTGGIDNDGDLRIVDSTISYNGTFYFGGGITNSGTLSIVNSVVAGNGTAYDGGGIVNFGTLKIDNSTLVQNNASQGVGGAIVNSGTLRVRNSTFSDNLAFWGGAIGNYSFGATVKIDQSTFSLNNALRGGVIYNAGVLEVAHSDISGTFSFTGGGIFTYPGSSTQLTNTSVSGTSAFEGGAITNFGTFSLKRSVISSNGGAERGGGVFNAGPLEVVNSVITNNTASIGGGIYICLEGELSFFEEWPCHGTLSLKKADIANNTPDDIFPAQ